MDKYLCLILYRNFFFFSFHLKVRCYWHFTYGKSEHLENQIILSQHIVTIGPKFILRLKGRKKPIWYIIKEENCKTMRKILSVTSITKAIIEPMKKC